MKTFKFNPEHGFSSIQRLGLYWFIHGQCTPEDNVLEIGCGDGMGLQKDGPPQIAEKAGEYLAIDKVKYNNPPFNFVQADIMEYGLSCLYDKIIALYVIQYVNPDKLFQLVFEHLVPGGSAYFSEGLAWQSGEEKQNTGQICGRMFKY